MISAKLRLVETPAGLETVTFAAGISGRIYKTYGSLRKQFHDDHVKPPYRRMGTLLSDVPAASCSRLMYAGAVPARFVVHKSAMRQDVSTA
jgi:hypothetical protein